MGLLQLMLSWVNRTVVLVSVVLFMVTLMCKETDMPFSQASLRVAHLCSFRYCTYISTYRLQAEGCRLPVRAPVSANLGVLAHRAIDPALLYRL